MSTSDNATKDEVVADATAPELATEETQQSVPADNALDDDAFDDIDDEIAEEAETESEEEATVASPGETETPAQPQDDQPASPEDEWNSLTGNSKDKFRTAINERNELRRQVQELTARKAQLATEQDLMNEINPETGEYYTQQEIERISWENSRKSEAERIDQQLFESQVRENQMAINDEVVQTTKEFPLIDPSSKDYVPEIGNQFAETLNDSLVYQLPNGQQANRTTLLANGINPDTQATLVGYTTSPYKLAKLAANSFNRAKAQGEAVGQVKAQQATNKMLVNADVPSGASGAKAKDPTSDFDEAWDE